MRLLTSFGIAGLAVVLLSMAAAVTLLPATVAAVGGRIRPSVPAFDPDGRRPRTAVSRDEFSGRYSSNLIAPG